MALSRIWSAFIIVAILVAGYRCFFAGDKQIFSRMVTGKADETYTTIHYKMVGDPAASGMRSKEDYTGYLAGYGYTLADSVNAPTVLLTDNPTADSIAVLKGMYPAAQVYTYRAVQAKLVKKADGII